MNDVQIIYLNYKPYEIRYGKDVCMSNNNVIPPEGVPVSMTSTISYKHKPSHTNSPDVSDYQWSAGELIHQLTVQFWSMISHPSIFCSRFHINFSYLKCG